MGKKQGNKGKSKGNQGGGKADDEMAFLKQMQQQNEKEVKQKQKQQQQKQSQNKKKQVKHYPNGQTWPEPSVPIPILYEKWKNAHHTKKNNHNNDNKNHNNSSNQIQQQHTKQSNENQNATTPEYVQAMHSTDVTKLTSYPPQGQIMEQPLEEVRNRYHSQEKKDDEKIEEQLKEVRQAAQVHREARKWFQDYVQPGMKMIDAADAFENKARELIIEDKKKAGLAFPLGCSMNYCAAHYTPNAGDNTKISKDDVIKFDLGLHVNGSIIDCAFTMYWNDQFQPLAEAVKEATNTGIQEAGIDVRLGDIGEAIQEVMESHEVEINGKTYTVKSIQNLSGHSIQRYKVHAGKTVPIVKSEDTTKMEENEFFAVETFGSTGRGYIEEEGVCSHYSLSSDYDGDGSEIRDQRSRELLQTINEHFGILPFCRRYLDRVGEQKYLMALRNLVSNNVVTEYPPLCDIRGCYTAQYEHTLFLNGLTGAKEVLSRGEDY